MIKFKYMKLHKSIIILLILSLCHFKIISQVSGIYNTEEYIPILKNKNVAIIVNQASLIYDKHLVDTLVNRGVNIKLILSPEHGFFGLHNAGEYVENDLYNGIIPIVSLYGENKKLRNESLKDIDIVLFDLQDVGVRFYTYISTLHYVMQGCARQDIPLIVLDRLNPHMHYVDGPVLEIEYASFVGMHPVPVVYGMSIGEYALMINGQGWLGDDLICNLHIIKNNIASRNERIDISIPSPSPNLRNMNAIFLYPSLCFFEGTVVSAGRGTDYPFEIYGAPFFMTDFSFVPHVNFGSKNPKFKDEICYGFDLRKAMSMPMVNDKEYIQISYLIAAYKNSPLEYKDSFFNSFFNKLAGNATLKESILENMSEQQIRLSWQKDIDEFIIMRKKYLLYD